MSNIHSTCRLSQGHAARLRPAAILAVLFVLPALCAAPGLKATSLPTPQTAALQETSAEVDGCWTRPDWPAAETLSLPKRLCIRKLKVVVPRSQGLPLGDGAALIVEGNPVSGRFDLSGAESSAGGWSVMGLSSRARNRRCGELNEAAVAVFAEIDQEGRLRQSPPRVHGILMDGAASCDKPAQLVEILYSRSQ
jgi:hypothetical protein